MKRMTISTRTTMMMMMMFYRAGRIYQAMNFMGCWWQQQAAAGLHYSRSSSCHPVFSSSQLQPIRTMIPEGTSAVLSGRRDTISRRGEGFGSIGL